MKTNTTDTPLVSIPHSLEFKTSANQELAHLTKDPAFAREKPKKKKTKATRRFDAGLPKQTPNQKQTPEQKKRC